jgi:hypothetical protein
MGNFKIKDQLENQKNVGEGSLEEHVTWEHKDEGDEQKTGKNRGQGPEGAAAPQMDCIYR